MVDSIESYKELNLVWAGPITYAVGRFLPRVPQPGMSPLQRKDTLAFYSRASSNRQSGPLIIRVMLEQIEAGTIQDVAAEIRA